MMKTTESDSAAQKDDSWAQEGRRMIRFEDLNAHGVLFGGRLAQWIDEAAAIYAICQMKTKRVVTLRISELLFKSPVRAHDVLEFRCRTAKKGRTSLTVETEVRTLFGGRPKTVCLAELQFVAVNEQGRATPWQQDPTT